MEPDRLPSPLLRYLLRRFHSHYRMSRGGNLDQLVFPCGIFVKEDDVALRRVRIVVECPMGEEVLAGLRRRQVTEQAPSCKVTRATYPVLY